MKILPFLKADFTSCIIMMPYFNSSQVFTLLWKGFVYTFVCKAC